MAQTAGQPDSSRKTIGGKLRLSPVEKQAECLALRKQGYTYEEIADKLGYANASGPWKAIDRALRKLIQEPAEELRKLELERLDVMLKSLWPFILKGSPRHVEIGLKVMDRRAALVGLDAPKQVEDHRTVTLTVMAEQWAEQSGLDASEIIAEANRIVAAAATETT